MVTVKGYLIASSIFTSISDRPYSLFGCTLHLLLLLPRLFVFSLRGIQSIETLIHSAALPFPLSSRHQSISDGLYLLTLKYIIISVMVSYVIYINHYIVLIKLNICNADEFTI